MALRIIITEQRTRKYAIARIVFSSFNLISLAFFLAAFSYQFLHDDHGVLPTALSGGKASIVAGLSILGPLIALILAPCDLFKKTTPRAVMLAFDLLTLLLMFFSSVAITANLTGGTGWTSPRFSNGDVVLRALFGTACISSWVSALVGVYLVAVLCEVIHRMRMEEKIVCEFDAGSMCSELDEEGIRELTKDRSS